jgi:hypothetical protein
MVTYPSGFALVFDGLLGIHLGCLYVIHSRLHVVLYPVNHLALNKGKQSKKNFLR